MTTTHPQTASEAYDEQVDRMLANLDRLQATLVRHRGNQRTDFRNWGFVADLNHWNALLDEITLANV